MTPFKTIFGNDLRTLALFRICVGLLVVYDLFNRSEYLYDHYSDLGILPRGDLLNHISSERFSLYLINGSVEFQALMFGIAILFGFALIFGYRTRLVTIVSWILLLSLQNRNPVLLQGGDNLLLLLLFWGMFLPLGARFSIDAALNKTPPKDNAYFSFATMGLALQCMAVYFFTVFLKSGPEYFPDGSAVYYALQIDAMQTPFGRWLGQFYELTRGLTFFVLFLELLAPIFIFSPFFFVPIRLAVMFLLIIMHLGFHLALEIGYFPFVSWVTILSFTPSWVWDKLYDRIATEQRKAVKIYYDIDCGFCRKTVLILRTFLLLPSTPIIPAQENKEIHDILVKHNSWVFQDYDGATYVRWQAMEMLFKRSWWLWPLGYIINAGPFKAIGEIFYQTVATYRPLLGRITGVMLPYHESSPRLPMIPNAIAAIMLVYVVTFNISTMPQVSLKMPEALLSVHRTLRLDQIWNMFAPFPLKYDGWHVIRGKLRDGTVVDLLAGKAGDPSFEKPEYASRLYEDYRWRKYFLRTKQSSYKKHYLYYGKYQCRKLANKKDPKKELVALRMYFNLEVTLPDYKTRPVERKLLWEHWCYNKADLNNFAKVPVSK